MLKNIYTHKKTSAGTLKQLYSFTQRAKIAQVLISKKLEKPTVAESFNKITQQYKEADFRYTQQHGWTSETLC